MTVASPPLLRGPRLAPMPTLQCFDLWQCHTLLGRLWATRPPNPPGRSLWGGLASPRAGSVAGPEPSPGLPQALFPPRPLPDPQRPPAQHVTPAPTGAGRTCFGVCAYNLAVLRGYEDGCSAVRCEAAAATPSWVTSALLTASRSTCLGARTDESQLTALVPGAGGFSGGRRAEGSLASESGGPRAFITMTDFE